MDWDAKEAELRASDWSDAEIRDYKRGYESVPTGSQMSMPAVVAPETPAYMLPEQFRRLPGGARGDWYRNTWAGMLRAVSVTDPPDEQAQEARAARDWADAFEFTYQRRPSLTESRFAVARRSDGVAFGSLDEFRRACRQAGVRLAVVDVSEPLPEHTTIIPQPVTR